jgi:hypothetical protein
MNIPLRGRNWSEHERAEIGRREALCAGTDQWSLECDHTDAGDPVFLLAFPKTCVWREHECRDDPPARLGGAMGASSLRAAAMTTDHDGQAQRRRSAGVAGRCARPNR